MNKKHEKRQKHLWSRLTLEGFVIVTSILLAFALDAAWEEHQEKGRQFEYLQVLEDEFRAAKLEMEEQLQDHERQMSSIDTILQDMERGENIDNRIFFSLFGLFYFGPAHPVFSDLANTSSVDVLEFGKLRFALFEYGKLKEFLTNLHSREMTFFQDHMEPYMARHLEYPAAFDPDGPKVPTISPDGSSLYDDPYFRNLLLRRKGTIRSQLRVGRQIAASIETILAELAVAQGR